MAILLHSTVVENNKPFLPNYRDLKQNNPNQKLFIVDAKQKNTPDTKYYFYNSDSDLRDWWLANGNIIDDDIIYWIKWDVKIDTILPELPESYDLVSKTMYIENINNRGNIIIKHPLDKTWMPENWEQWNEIDLFGDLLNNHSAIRLITPGLYIFKKWVIEEICKPEYDYLFKQQIISELRFPTIAALERAKIGTIDMSNIKTFNLRPESVSHNTIKTQSNNENKPNLKRDPPEIEDPTGPGSMLISQLKNIGITSSPNCSCKARARLMNKNGCDWCETNIDTIVGWLREEATKRKLPFIDLAGKLLVKRSIRLSRNAKK
jgi:hypothetical protein